MTDPSAKRKIHLARGIQSGLKTVEYYPRLCFGQQSTVSRLSRIPQAR